MIYVRRGSQAFEMLTILSVVGEFPNCSIHLLGRERVYQSLVAKLTEPQTFCQTETGKQLTTKLLTLSGKRGDKTVRLYRKALPILDCIAAEFVVLEGISVILICTDPVQNPQRDLPCGYE